MATRISLLRRVNRKVPRLTKVGRQWIRAVASGGRPRTRVVFVLGAQRSGTRLPLQVLDRSPEIATFSEGAHPYFSTVLLQPLDRVERLLSRSPSPVVALKPICETHRVHELLDRFPESRAIWIFRDHKATALSASIKWKGGREAIRRMAMGEMDRGDWRLGGLTAEKLALIKHLYRNDMSLYEANALMWYLRSGLFFDLGAHTRPEVLLVRYEDLLANPLDRFTRLFDFIGVRLPAGVADVVDGSRPTDKTFPPLAEELRVLAEDLHERLLAHYLGPVGFDGSPVPHSGVAR